MRVIFRNLFLSVIFLLVQEGIGPSRGFAYPDDTASKRMEEVNRALDSYERQDSSNLGPPNGEDDFRQSLPVLPDPEEYLKDGQEQENGQEDWFETKRQEIINKTLDELTVKIETGYMFVRGEHSFRLDHTDYEGNLSKLTYPLRGGMSFIGAEGKMTPRLSLGGRYATSNFSNKTSKDEDWNFWGDHNGVPTFIDYQITEQDTENEAFFWNADIYYRLLNWEKKDIEENLADYFVLDKLNLDAFTGYQYYRGRHTMVDPITEYRRLIGSQWWYVPTVPLYEGLNSWYRVTYQGPRVGLRLGGSYAEKISSSLSLSYAFLKTEADGYWNLRDFRWHHEGKGYGSAINVDFETKYFITSNWYLGGGLNYMWQKQKDLLYSGTQPGSSFTDLDIARDTQMSLLGFSLKVGFCW
jgi:hypothetical protein